MNSTGIFLFTLLLSSLQCYGQVQDTVRLQAAEVVEKQKHQLFSPGVVVSAVDSQVLRQNFTENLTQLLATHSAVFVKDYGSGSIATLSFRGTNASQTQLSWNGFPINSASHGELDLSLVPVSLMDDISLLHGGSSSLYGSGAIGGSIHLTNKPQWQKGTLLQLSHEMGSFESHRSRIRLNTGTASFQSALSVFFNSSKNNFPYINTAQAGAPVIRQVHADTRHYGCIQSFYFKLNERNTLSAGIWYQSSDRKIPPMMTAFSSEATQQDSALRTYLAWTRAYSRGNVSLRTAYFDEHLYYQDPFSQTDSYNKQRKYQTEGEFRMRFTEKLLLITGTTSYYIRARVSGYGRDLVQESRFSIFSGLRYEPFRDWKTSLTLRKEFVRGYAPPPVPALGFEGRLLKHCLYLKGNYNHNFSLPTLNQRYWITGGNPDLKPESGKGAELGLKLRVPQRQYLEAEIIVYHSRISNWLQWAPVNDKFWAPLNLKKVWSRGLEAILKYQRFMNNMHFSLAGNYAHTLSSNEAIYVSGQEETIGKQLMYVPLHNANGSIYIMYKKYTWSYNQTYTGMRYTTSDNSHYLEPYTLGNVILSKQFMHRQFSSHLQFKISNVWNASYQSISWWAMPGRAYYLTWQLAFNNRRAE